MSIKSSRSVKSTQQIAQNLAKKYQAGAIIALSGDLGAGKTTFVQGFAKGLGIKDQIISPTFVLIRQHQLPDSEKMLYHIDLYRLEGEPNITELGIKELLEGSDLVLIEWAEKIKDQLPKKTIFINIEKISEDERKIEIRGEQ